MPMSPMTERLFVGEVLPHMAELRRVAYSMTRNRADADDLLQDTLARAMVKLHLWEPGTRIVPWLAVMMRNIRRSAYSRAWSRVQWCPLEDFDAPAPPSQFDVVTLKETSELWAAMPDHQREVLELIALDGLSYEEAADRLAIPVGTVRSRLSRARDTLRLAVFGHDAPVQPAARSGTSRNSDTKPRSSINHRASTAAGRSVLLVEDELWLAMALEDDVRAAGFNVVGPVGRLQDAIELARSETIDAAVLDIRLHRETVFPVADILVGKHIPFAFVTAFPESDIQLPHRGRPVWNKPINRPRFQQELRYLLDSPDDDAA